VFLVTFGLATIVLRGQTMIVSASDPAPTVKQSAEPSSRKLLETFLSEFVEISPGIGKYPASFVMGTERGPWCEQPAHRVKFGYSFHIAKYEVPQNLYQAVMGKNPSRWKGSRNSAENFTWNEAQEFLNRLTRMLHNEKLIGEDEVIRMPTEAEWEYCCRAGTTTAYSFGESATAPEDVGNRASVLSKFSWHTGNAAGNDPPVGALHPNPWGLYDMHGYLWEYVSDAWSETYAGAPADGGSRQSSETAPRRIVRGGSWMDRYECHRCAYRRPIEQNTKGEGIGLRCIRSDRRLRASG
jgi:formylglycine-generating enzyme required for sulfatase activity